MKLWHNFWLGMNARELYAMFIGTWAAMGAWHYWVNVEDMINLGIATLGLLLIISYILIHVRIFELGYKALLEVWRRKYGVSRP